METLLPNDVSLIAFVLACLITGFGGFVKGAVGFAQPLIMVAGMGIFLPPAIVVAGIVIPIVIANALQVMRAGWAESLAALKEFQIYVGIVCLSILIFAQFLTALAPSTMFLVLGVPVVILCLVQLFGLRVVIPVHLRKGFSIIAGLIAGALGGLAGTWGPPTVLYLLAVETPKARQMAAQGVIYGLGALALLAGHLQSGVLNNDTIPFSAALVFPSVVGMWLGFKVQDRLDQERFRRVTLIVLTIAGLNLIRKGLFG